MPSAEPSPRPWRVVDYAQCPGLADIFDASGSPSGLVAGELKPADAALIVDAVNERAKFEEARMEFPDFRPVIIAAGQRDAAISERDRLRDQLAAALRLADECSRDAAAVHAERARAVEEAQSDANRRADRLADIVRRMLPLASERLATMGAADCELIREARAAIGEDAP